jgi:hypothetical protein
VWACSLHSRCVWGLVLSNMAVFLAGMMLLSVTVGMLLLSQSTAVGPSSPVLMCCVHIGLSGTLTSNFAALELSPALFSLPALCPRCHLLCPPLLVCVPGVGLGLQWPPAACQWH